MPTRTPSRDLTSTRHSSSQRPTRAARTAYGLNYGVKGPNGQEYCNICNPFQYDTTIMANPTQVAAHIHDTVSLYADITNGMLPAVSSVKPSGYVDGHPSSSKLDLFEAL